MTNPAHKAPPTKPLRQGGTYTKNADGTETHTPGTIQRGTPEHRAALEKKPAPKKETDK